MKWKNVKLIYLRELRDQLRDRRTMFTIAVLPLMLYPLLGMLLLKMGELTKQESTKVWIIGAENLPQYPSLIEDSKFAARFFGSDLPADLLKLEFDAPPPQATFPELEKIAEHAIDDGTYDAVVYFPPEFKAKLEKFQAAILTNDSLAPNEVLSEGAGIQPKIFFNTAKDPSRIAYDRLIGVLRHWREDLVLRNLENRRVPIEAMRPFEIVNYDVAADDTKRALLWAKILPFVMLVWALTGAFYPAIDLCAGEKERGTLETLLSSPAARSEIVWGKLLTVMSFSVATSLMNLFSMVGTGTFVISAFGRAGVFSSLTLGPPPVLALIWLIVALGPIAALFSALSLAVAAFARSSKEGQYYLMPLLMISLPLMMLPLLPGLELNFGTSLIPISGAMLLLRSLIEGDYTQVLPYVIPVIGVTALCCHLAIRWAVDQFNNESVIFRESERFGLGIWLKHMMRDRGPTPTMAEALFCGMVLLMLNFFSSLAATGIPATFGELASIALITQLALIATPTLLMTIMLTTSPRRTLLLKMPKPMAIPAAIALALVLNPMAHLLGYLVQQLYPMSTEVQTMAQQLSALFHDSPSIWITLAVIALTPAICEELTFRGFILSGLRHSGHKWTAILISSVFFGAVHGMLQQSLSACVVGVLLGYLAMQTGSILPGVLYHVVHNSLAVLIGFVTPSVVLDYPLLSWIFEFQEGSVGYTWQAVAIGGVAAVGILFWFHSLQYQPTAEERLQSALDHQPRAGAATP